MDMPPVLTDNLVSAAGEVFEMMIGQTIEPHPEEPREPPKEWGTHVAASVSFAGHRSGLVCIHTSLAAANRIAGGMLGIEAEHVNGEMPDAMGEVANLVAGSFRTRLAASEPASAIASISATGGSNRRSWPMPRTSPASRQRATERSASAFVSANGFSQKMCLPAATAAAIWSVCSEWGVASTTASTAGSFSASA